MSIILSPVSLPAIIIIVLCKNVATAIDKKAGIGGSSKIPAAIKVIEPIPGINLFIIIAKEPYFLNHVSIFSIMFELKYFLIKVLDNKDLPYLKPNK